LTFPVTNCTKAPPAEINVYVDGEQHEMELRWGKDPANGCHFSVTRFRLTDYMPLVGDPTLPDGVRCNGDALGPRSVVTMAAQQNYTAAQARMKRDPQLAALLQRPLGNAQHPRKIFAENSAEADVIRLWATQFSQ